MIYPGHNIRKHPEAESWWHWAEPKQAAAACLITPPTQGVGKSWRRLVLTTLGPQKSSARIFPGSHSATWHGICAAKLTTQSPLKDAIKEAI